MVSGVSFNKSGVRKMWAKMTCFVEHFIFILFSSVQFKIAFYMYWCALKKKLPQEAV